jgi:uncharacterized membrane protein YGL010W
LRPIDDWLEEYGASHRHPLNEWMHRICVPLIAISLIALLWALPVPRSIERGWVHFNWGLASVAASLLYYTALSLRLALGMAILAGAVIALASWSGYRPESGWPLALVVFVAAWIGQAVGHAIEGRRPSFFKDLQFLLIGPLWLLAAAYRALGIRY